LPSRTAGEGRFVPGTLLADRYRIVGRVGRGGMGEVYRADDLRLGQTVALKFLNEALQDDPELLERLYGEVRVARQVSHPAVCRVYDVGEMEGLAFLSMEFVDGEDLATLQRRIGRPPYEKALDVARQLCAGLAAAHAKDVLHRDLKPENVMIDGRGRVRITDFGIAGLASDIRDDDVRSGTPAYMSPEQLAGREVTVRSDIYALGLVLYELFTGRKAFEGRTRKELERKHREEAPTRPSAVVEGLDPAVERAILRCLEKEPERRPATALTVAAALPGGDPLAEALAAGETPSPEAVAAARSEGLPRPVAWALAVATLACAVLVPVLVRPVQLFHLQPFEKPPDALEDRAHELLRRLGYAEPPADAARGYAVDAEYFGWVSERDQSPGRWDSLRTGQPPVVQFWYRQSPRVLLSTAPLGRVSSRNPPVVDSGMAGVRFDMRGRLVQFYAVPVQKEGETGSAEPAESTANGEPDWSGLFAEAQLDPERFRRVTPQWTPQFFADTRAAWEGVFPDRPEIPIRVEAAGFQGRPAWFEIVPPWKRAERMEPFARTIRQRVAFGIGMTLVVLLVGASAWLAHRNLARGRGDRQGAFRLAVYAVGVGFVGWAFWAHHVADLGGELHLFFRADGFFLLVALVIWVLYLALEPYVRGQSPHLLISWTRLLSGRWRDGTVGRDVLVGTAAGALMAVLLVLSWRLPAWIGHAPGWPEELNLDAFLGVRERIMMVLFGHLDGAVVSLAMLVLLVLLRMVVRSERAAGAVILAVVALPDAIGGQMPFAIALLGSMAVMSVAVVVLLRFGLLAVMLTLYVCHHLLQAPFGLRLGHWTGAPTAFSLAFLVLLVAWGLWASASRRRLAVVHELAA
jgi:serine/threonine-protein kinase